MDILYLMIICSVSLAIIFLIIFIIGVENGQFEDNKSPAIRMLFDSEVETNKEEQKQEEQKQEEQNIDKK